MDVDTPARNQVGQGRFLRGRPLGSGITRSHAVSPFRANCQPFTGKRKPYNVAVQRSNSEEGLPTP